MRANYQGSDGHHLSQLMNLNRYDGSEYNATLSTANARPNPLYTGFNYRANNLNSNYNAMVTEVQKRYEQRPAVPVQLYMVEADGSRLGPVQGSTSHGGYSQPFYLVTNNNPPLEYGPGAFDHQKNFKTIFTYELPFLKNQPGLRWTRCGRLAGFGFLPGLLRPSRSTSI